MGIKQANPEYMPETASAMAWCEWVGARKATLSYMSELDWGMPMPPPQKISIFSIANVHFDDALGIKIERMVFAIIVVFVQV